MPIDKCAYVDVKHKIDRWSTYLVNNCYTHTTYEIAVQSNMNNGMELRVCAFFFVYLFWNIVAFSFDMPEYFLFFLSTWFRIKNQTQIISTSMALENLLFNHFNSRLAMTGLFFQDCRASSYPVFLFISQFEECKSMIIIIAPRTVAMDGWIILFREMYEIYISWISE